MNIKKNIGKILVIQDCQPKIIQPHNTSNQSYLLRLFSLYSTKKLQDKNIRATKRGKLRSEMSHTLSGEKV